MSIADINEGMRSNLVSFISNYEALGAGKKTVTECIEQLSAFSEKGLKVDSAMSPLKDQLKSLSELQNGYLNKLLKIKQEFDSVVSEMSKISELSLSK